MRILIVSNLYPPYARGGAELIAWRTAHALYARGHDVTVLSTRPGGGPFASPKLDVETELETVYRFRPPNLYHVLNGGAYPFAARALWHVVDTESPVPALIFSQVVQETKPDIVLTHNLKGIGLKIASAIRRLGLPHAHVIHDIQLSVPSGLLLYGEEGAWMNRGILRRMYERRVQRIVGSPDVIVSPSHWLADFYRARGFFPRSTFAFLPNPAPETSIAPRATRPPGPVRLLFAGQLEEHKGVRFLLEALDTLDIPFVLHVAGDGHLAKFVMDRASHDKRVFYHGFVSLDNLINLFSICDAVLVPSLCYENSPTIIYESFLAGSPVIASNIGGVGELVHDGENGILVTPGSRAELLAAIRSVAANADAWRAKDAAIRATVEPYRMGKYVERLEGVMNEVVAKKRT